MRRTAALAVAGWLAAAAAAIVAGLAVVALIGRGLVGPGPDEPMTADEVARALAATTAVTAGPDGGPTPPAVPSGTPPSGSPRPPAAATALTSPGGTVFARCSGGEATLVNWSPAPGYSADEVRPGPAHDARVTFQRNRDDDDEIEMRVECGADGVPVASWKRD